VIDPDVYYTLGRAKFPPNADVYTVGFSTHRLKPLLTSAVFSHPAELLQMDAGGSVGEQVSDIESWGPHVGNVSKTEQTRTFYRKQYCVCPVCNDPRMKMRWLWGELRLRGVKSPVVRHIYVERHGIYMMWRYIYTPTRQRAGSQRLKEWSVDEDFEGAFTFDIIAADKIPLETGDINDAIRFAHDRNFLYGYVRPVLLTAHSEPSPIARREWIEVPKVIIRAVPIARWRAPELPL